MTLGIAACCVALVLPYCIGATELDEFRAGASVVDITPPIGYRHGGGYNEVISTGVRDPLYAKAMVVQQGKTSFVVVECDLLSVPEVISSQVRRIAKDKVGISESNIVIAATHNHGSPEYWGPLRDIFHERQVEMSGADIHESIDYPKLLSEGIVEAIEMAVGNFEPMTVEIVTARQEGLAFNRRFHMDDGSVVFNPGKMNPSIVRPAGPVDEDLPFLLFRRATDQQAKFSFCVFAMHTAVFDDTAFSADYPGHLQRSLQSKFGKDFISIFGEGCAGDVNHVDVRSPKAQPGSTEPIRIGKVLFDTIDSQSKHATQIEPSSIDALSRAVPVEIIPVTQDEVNFGFDLLRNQDSNGAPFLSLVDAWRKWHAWHERSLHGEMKPLEVQVLRIGSDTAIVFLPHEIFVELGMTIKSSSPFRNTVVVSLANDVDYYVPTRRAFEEGSYEVTTCPLAPGCGEKLTSLAIELLHELKNGIRQ